MPACYYVCDSVYCLVPAAACATMAKTLELLRDQPAAAGALQRFARWVDGVMMPQMDFYADEVTPVNLALGTKHLYGESSLKHSALFKCRGLAGRCMYAECVMWHGSGRVFAATQVQAAAAKQCAFRDVCWFDTAVAAKRRANRHGMQVAAQDKSSLVPAVPQISVECIAFTAAVCLQHLGKRVQYVALFVAGNWHSTVAECFMSYGILTDNRSRYEKGVKLFQETLKDYLKWGRGGFTEGGRIIGECSETLRDIYHSQFGFGESCKYT